MSADEVQEAVEATGYLDRRLNRYRTIAGTMAPGQAAQPSERFRSELHDMMLREAGRIAARQSAHGAGAGEPQAGEMDLPVDVPVVVQAGPKRVMMANLGGVPAEDAADAAAQVAAIAAAASTRHR